MEYFSFNAFILGVLIYTCAYLSNILYSLLCFIWAIKIMEFGVFSNPWFSLHTETISGTKYILGWLPLGCHIKPLGLEADEEEKLKIKSEDLPFAFFNKPYYLKVAFRLVPLFVYILAFIIAISVFSNSNIISETKIFGNYIWYTLTVMFSEQTMRKSFIEETTIFFNGKNIVAFCFAMLNFISFFFYLFLEIFHWSLFRGNKKTIIRKVISAAFMILFVWLILWKIPVFVFSFFTFTKILIYNISFLGGMYLVGVVFFFTTLFVMKNYEQFLNDRKFYTNKR